MKEIHAKMLHKHLQRLEEREDGEEKLDMADHLQPEEESEPDANGMHYFIFLPCFSLRLESMHYFHLWVYDFVNNIVFLICFLYIDAETYSPERIEEEVHVAEEEAEEAGSFSPELLHGDENEEVMDPEEDRAILVSFLIIREHSRFQSALV